jgi:hypothetical protein
MKLNYRGIAREPRISTGHGRDTGNLSKYKSLILLALSLATKTRAGGGAAHGSIRSGQKSRGFSRARSPGSSSPSRRRYLASLSNLGGSLTEIGVPDVK